MNLNIVIFGLSITSAWGNGHASTYRALTRALAQRGHTITFLERDVPWYREHRDAREFPYCRVELYRKLPEVARRFGALVRGADLVIIGSYVPDGIALGEWVTSHARGVTAFYDIDTPVTVAKLESGTEYLAAHLIPRFDLFLSFTGGPILLLMEEKYGSPRARALYCAADLELHSAVIVENRWTLGYIGTYSPDRQLALQKLLFQSATALPQERFVIAGAQYPADSRLPANVVHIEHVAPADHAAFYCAQRFTLNLTRADMVARGYSPSVRLFEAAACGVPIISDRWPGLETIFTPGEEILVAKNGRDVVEILTTMPQERRRAIAAAARKRLFRSHTADHRARELESYYKEVVSDGVMHPKEVVA
jgi:spore maturation protein CgeB